MYSDINITCKACNNPFTLTAGEQEFFATRTTSDGQPLTPPKRCKSCRAQARAQREGGAPAQAPTPTNNNAGGGQFHPGGGYSSAGGDKGRGKRGGPDRGRRNDRSFNYDD